MSNTVKVDLAVSDNGTTAKVTSEAKKLNKELDQAKKTAAGIRSASQTSALSSSNDLTDVGANRLAKGISGASGAASRDFAKQAQGLGGLVHVYATFAANLFAVSAGFTALSKAADYDNMIRGLDQLGAASGRNLGGISKNVVALTDGAISLKEAMAAVAQASSAGMSSKQIEQMATVAKQASQALGRDMTDSINRLSRGITKMEPELLDELGIFVRVDKATADYARTVGKTANSLTDFERRQAFATASLDQAQKKFGAIDLASNSFSKLQASVTDLLYSSGSLLNKVLGPIAEYLSNSPSALSVGLVTLVAILTKQAIPAISEMRKGLEEAAITSGNTAKRFAEDAKKSREQAAQKRVEQADWMAEARTAQVENIFSRVTDQTKGKKVAGWATKLLENPNIGREVTDKDLAKLDKYSLKNSAVADTYKKIASAIREAKAAEEEYDAAVRKMQDERASKGRLFSVERMNNLAAEKATRAALASSAVAAAAEGASVAGFAGGYVKLKESVANARIEAEKAGTTFGKFAIATTYVRGGLAITTTVLGKAVGALGTLGMAVSIAVAAFEVISMVLSKNSKQAAEFSKSIEGIASAVDMAGKTSEYLSKLDPLERMSSSALDAKANSIMGISDATETLVEKFQKLEKASTGWFDSLTNFISRAWGGDRSTKFAESFASSIETSLKNIDSPKARASLEKSLDSILGTDRSKDVDRIKLFAEVGDEVTLKKISKALKDAGIEISNTSSRAKEFTNSLTQVIKSSQTLNTSLLPQDARSKFSIDMINMSKSLAGSMNDAEAATSSLYELMKDNTAISLLPPAAFEQIRSIKPMMEDNIDTIGRQKEALGLLREELQKEEKLKVSTLNPVQFFKSNQSIKDLKKGIAEVEKDILANQEKSIIQVRKLSAAIYDSAATNLTTAITAAHKMAALEYRDSISKMIGGIGGAQLDTQIAKERISVEQSLIKAVYTQIETTTKNSLILERDYQERLKKDAIDSKDTTKETLASTRISQLTTAIERIGTRDIQKSLQKSTGSPEDSLALKNDLGSLAIAQLNKDQQLAALSSKTEIATLQGKAKEYEKVWELAQKLANESVRDNKAELDKLKSLRASSDILDEDLDNKIAQAQLNTIAAEQAAMQATQGKDLNNLLAVKAHLESKSSLSSSEQLSLGKAKLEIDRTTTAHLSEKRAKTQQDILDIQKNELEVINRKYAAEQKRLNISNALKDMYSDSLGKKASAGLITKSQEILGRADIDVSKESDKFNIDKAYYEQRIKNEPQIAQQLRATIAEKEKERDLNIGKIKLEAEYQAALVKTEENLRSMERTGNYSSDYFSSMNQDFSNKINDLVKNTKSAASAFNEGFINAVDSSIDKYFEMLQTSTFKMKDLVNFTRTALSDVFRDTASNILKGVWKNAIKDFLPKSDEEKASKRLADSLDALNATIQGKTLGASGVGLSGGTLGPSIGKSAYDKQDAIAAELNAKEGFETSADTNKEASSGFVDSAVSWGSGVKNFLLGSETNTGIFQKAIEGFANLMPSWLNSTYRVIASAISGIAMSGGGGGGSSGSAMSGILGIVLKAGMGYLTGGWGGAIAGAAGGTTSALMSNNAGPMTSDAGIAANAADVNSAGMGGFAKGGVFDGSSSLSAYSNSVVSSPTMFAFAKGAGLMGESGPEAIIPLKRDDQGNLGIRGGTNAMENTFNINVTVEGGGTKEEEDSSGKGNMASELGKSVKAAVIQELINQKRPGGLLAK